MHTPAAAATPEHQTLHHDSHDCISKKPTPGMRMWQLFNRLSPALIQIPAYAPSPTHTTL